MSIIGVSSGYLRDKGSRFFGIKQTTDSMNRRTKSIEQRNREIYADYIAHLRNGMPVMMAYATIAHRYDLSENHVRNIIMAAAKNH